MEYNPKMKKPLIQLNLGKHLANHHRSERKKENLFSHPTEPKWNPISILLCHVPLLSLSSLPLLSILSTHPLSILHAVAHRGGGGHGLKAG
jgi:hypothetical protein